MIGVAEPRANWSQVPRRPPASVHRGLARGPPHDDADMPNAFATQLKSQGYRFVGPTSVYAFMQNVGVVNDHIHGCFRASDYRPAR